jgi:hypothetical protein
MSNRCDKRAGRGVDDSRDDSGGKALITLVMIRHWALVGLEYASCVGSDTRAAQDGSPTHWRSISRVLRVVRQSTSPASQRAIRISLSRQPHNPRAHLGLQFHSGCERGADHVAQKFGADSQRQGSHWRRVVPGDAPTPRACCYAWHSVRASFPLIASFALVRLKFPSHFFHPADLVKKPVGIGRKALFCVLKTKKQDFLCHR